MFFAFISWTAYQNFLFGWIVLAIAVLFLIFKVTAPYGRHSSGKWGPMIPNKWGWLLMELPVLLVLWYFVLPEKKNIDTASWVMIGLFTFHYFNRVFIFPFRLRTEGKKMPLLIVLSAVFFNLVNGFSFGYYFSNFSSYPDAWFTDARFISGLILFFAGIYINWKADNILIHLRKPGETGYKIPRGWLFEKISCPNLFGEILEWSGFAILCWNLPALTFLIWTAANLIPRAVSHHKWYKEKFSDYPATRKAVIPFLW
jgi:hypothetical protein